MNDHPRATTRRSLDHELALVVAGIVLVASAAIAAVGAFVGSRLARQQFERNARSLAYHITAGLRVAVTAGSIDFIHELAESTMADSSVLGVAAFDRSGRLLARHGVDSAWRTVPPAVLSDGATVVERGPNGFDVAVPVLGGAQSRAKTDPTELFFPSDRSVRPTRIEGAVVLHLSTASLDEIEREILLLSAPIAVVLALLLAGLAASASRTLTRPLRELARRVGRFPVSLAELASSSDDRPELASLKTALLQGLEDSQRHLRALEDSERRARAVFDQSPDPMALVDASGVLVDQNPALRRLTAAMPAPHRLESVFQLEREADWRAGGGEGPPRTAAATLALPNGERRIGVLSLLELTRLGESLTLARFEDRTERLREEARRRNLEEQLAHGEKLNALGVMAAGIAHDFNNQLNVMLGNLRIVQEELPADHGLRPLLADVEAASRHCVELTKGLRHYTRVEPMIISPFGMNDLIAEMLRMLKRSLPPRVEVRTVCRPGVLSVLGDPARIHQVLLNLCLNAVDAMPSGGVLTIECEERPIVRAVVDESTALTAPDTLAGPVVRVTVTDTGTGMDADTLSRAFDPFFTTKPVGKGTGLGLSTAVGVVRAHGGRIHATTQPGVGSQFTIELPAAETRQELERSDPSYLVGGSETVLLAEDDERLRHITQTILARLGYRVFTACDGHEALSLFRDRYAEIDLLILDLVMPGLGGDELVDWLRIHGHTHPVLFVSGYPRERAARGADETGTAFLAKPYSAAELATLVRSTLASTQSW